eukprot:5974479-Prymnesium_polylepis.1
MGQGLREIIRLAELLAGRNGFRADRAIIFGQKELLELQDGFSVGPAQQLLGSLNGEPRNSAARFAGKRTGGAQSAQELLLALD